MAIFSKTVTLIFDLHDLELGTKRKILSQGISHVRYEGPKSYQSKDMANVKVFVDKHTDKRTGPKTICPRSIDALSAKQGKIKFRQV